MRGARGRSGSARAARWLIAGAARRRRLGRALLGLSRGPLRRAPGEPGGHHRLGALGPHGHRRSRRRPVARGLRVAPAEAAAGWLLAQQAVNGVFFGSAMLDYRLYKSYFPAWALTRAAALTRTALLIALRRLGARCIWPGHERESDGSSNSRPWRRACRSSATVSTSTAMPWPRSSGAITRSARSTGCADRGGTTPFSPARRPTHSSCAAASGTSTAHRSIAALRMSSEPGTTRSPRRASGTATSAAPSAPRSPGRRSRNTCPR